MKRLFTAIIASTLTLPATAIAHEKQSEERVDATALKQKAKDVKAAPKPLEHSGGTDARGCHTNHSTGDYHCHKPK